MLLLDNSQSYSGLYTPSQYRLSAGLGRKTITGQLEVELTT